MEVHWEEVAEVSKQCTFQCHEVLRNGPRQWPPSWAGVAHSSLHYRSPGHIAKEQYLQQLLWLSLPSHCDEVGGEVHREGVAEVSKQYNFRC